MLTTRRWRLCQAPRIAARGEHKRTDVSEANMDDDHAGVRIDFSGCADPRFSCPLGGHPNAPVSLLRVSEARYGGRVPHGTLGVCDSLTQ
jgi:hypothetical protein